MAKGYRLKGTVSSGNNVDPDDVWVLKHALHRNGFYSTPSDGITPYPDSNLFDAIKQFQAENGLRADGVVAPGGKTEGHMRPLLLVVATHRCVHCKAWHGGLFSPRVCADCWGKGFR
jgi:hypothetical protein